MTNNNTALPDYAGRIGKLDPPARLTFDHIDVVVLEARRAYGRVDLHVRPLAGPGSAWVSAPSVTIDDVGEA